MATQLMQTRDMSAISSVSVGQAALPFGGQQIRLRESKRAAEQAEQTAQTLRQKADQAQQDADSAQNTASGLAVKAGQAENYASQVRRGTQVVDSKAATSSVAPTKVDGVITPPTQQAQGTDKSTASGSTLPGVVNLSGQKLGQFINVAV